LSKVHLTVLHAEGGEERRGVSLWGHSVKMKTGVNSQIAETNFEGRTGEKTTTRRTRAGAERVNRPSWR